MRISLVSFNFLSEKNEQFTIILGRRKVFLEVISGKCELLWKRVKVEKM